MNFQKFSVAFGFFVWLIATIIFSFWGHLFFIPDNHLLVISFFLGVVPILYFLQTWVFRKYTLTKETQLRSAVLMALPGMLFDVFCFQFHAIVFPKLSIQQIVTLEAWVLWVYALVLVIGLFYQRKN